MWCATSQRQPVGTVSWRRYGWPVGRWCESRTLAFTSTPTWGRELFRGVSPYSASGDRFAGIFRQSRSRHVWFASVLSSLDWGNGIIEGLTPYLVRRLQSVLITSARSKHALTSTGCTPRSTSSLRSLCWRIKFFMGLRRSYRIGIVSALPALIAWSCHHSNCPLLAVEHLRLLLLRHRTVCQRT